MVTITLTNRKSNFPDKQVVIDVFLGSCTFPDKREISIKELINSPDFSHPLLKEPFSHPTGNLFHYEYDTVDEMLYAGIYVYSRLIQTENPLKYTFKINPSQHFHDAPCADRFYFSHNGNTAAEYIDKKQLEGITSSLLGLKFTFCENIIIDDLITFEDLPVSVNGDALYESNEELIDLLKNPKDCSPYEIRYLNSEIGFGLFAKKNIKKDDTISFYTGVKNSNKDTNRNFSFSPSKDCLDMYLDAIQYGNITRYINHAPSKNDETKKSLKHLLTSNIKADMEYINGIEFVVYRACKNISIGEQLLVNYGDQYFVETPMIRFKSNGGLIKTPKKRIRNNPKKKIYDIKAMAEHGVKKAQLYLLVRMIVIVSVLVGAFQGLMLILRM